MRIPLIFSFMLVHTYAVCGNPSQAQFLNMQKKSTPPMFPILMPRQDLLKYHEPMQQFLGFHEPLDTFIQAAPPVTSRKISLPYEHAQYAKWDLIHGFTHNAIVISERFKKLLAQFHLPQHQYFPCEIKMQRGKIVHYFCLWLPVLPLNPSPIDFEKTPFYKQTDKKWTKS